jgi:preprotein translocase subunit SecE
MADNKSTTPSTDSVRQIVEKKSLKSEQTKSPVTDRRIKLSNKSKDKKSSNKTRRFHIIPKFIKSTFTEIRQVTWPDRKITVKLTVAVVLFSLIFSALVGSLDWVFEIIFKKVFLHG